MMKPIDKQVQETMNQLDHPYSQAYWEQALVHIEKRERKRRRIRGFWWTMASLMIISAVSLIGWFNSDKKETELIESDQILADNTPQEISKSKESNVKFYQSGIGQNAYASISNKDASLNIRRESPSNPVVEATPSLLNTNITQRHISAEFVVAETHSSIANENIISLREGSEQSLERVFNDSEESTEQVYQVSTIPVLISSMIESELKWQMEKPELNSELSIQPLVWKLNILSELNALTNVPGKSHEKACLGGQAALGARWTAGTGFFAGMSGGYALRTGTFGNMLDHPTPEYVFEKKEEGFRLIPTTLSYALTQFYSGWELGRWSGRVGLQPMYLIGATGELHQYSSEVSGTDPGVILSRVSKVSEGSIATPAFRNWVFEMQAGLEFVISDRWRLIGQFVYTPNGLTYPLVENTYDPIEGKYEFSKGESILKEQFFHIQIGIQYKW